VEAQTFGTGDRWELYRLLGEPIRLRMLALAKEDELSVGELAELLGETQPNVSRHVSALRKAQLLSERKQGTRVFVRLADLAQKDAVVLDALRAGRALTTGDGSLARVAELVRARDAAARVFFASKAPENLEPDALAPELPSYLAAFAPLLPHRDLAIDVGTGDGRMLDLLAPLFAKVIAFDRSATQLARARARVERRGYANVELLEGDLEDPALRARLETSFADVVVASRVLHHAPKPVRTLEALATLLRPGGALVVIDYAPHDDERMQAAQADLWLGFNETELADYASQAGLSDPRVTPLLAARGTPDAHVPWHALVARKP
jgi:SAM-dependent methyltransferase/biotin operon repressor